LSDRPANLDLLLDVSLSVTAELGRATMRIGELADLGTGAVVELDRAAGAAIDVLVNGRIIARGEIVAVDERFGVRITELVSKAIP
jgi:flagellar motor switch protein FliN/FliY